MSSKRVGQRLSLGLLALTLAAGGVVPALAKGPDHHSAAHAQRQEAPLSAEKKGKGKGGKFKTVKRTFANDAAIAIPGAGSADDFGPAGPYPSPIQVSGFTNARISDVNLTLHDFSHEFTRDVDVLLVAPNGRNLVVLGDVGSATPSARVENLTITLDDEAPAPPSVVDDAFLTSGTFQPLDNLGLVDEPPDPSVLLDFPAPAPSPSGDNTLASLDGGNPNGQWQLFVLDDVAGDKGNLAAGWELEITAKVKKKRR